MIHINAPEGAPWEFLLVFGVVLVGPALIERARVPGIIGLILGGFVIGPHGLGWIGPGNTTVPELGKLGLLYLMFVAGVELDLHLLRKHRGAVVSFGLLTFALPMIGGTAVGFILGWSIPAALLLGSMLASHTLLVYPTVRDFKLTSDPSVATAVGATVLTDTISLVVLAGVSGAEQGSGSPAELAFQITFGIVALVAICLLALPPLAKLAFRYLGADPKVRYVVAVASFLIAATVAEMFGIEGIVGAFFAGLALNRMVPNEGTLMERVDFFGGAVFVPVFLVSVGLILNPKVMVEPTTLGLAGLLIAACLGGKALAAALTKPMFKYSGAQSTLVYALTSPQAAATLATVVVGFNIGLFSTAVVNATLALILVSVLAGSIVGSRAARAIPIPKGVRRPAGARVVVAIDDLELARPMLRAAAEVARRDSGVVHAIAVRDDANELVGAEEIEAELGAAAHAYGVDGEVELVADRTLLEGARHAGLTREATLVLIGVPDSSDPIESSAGPVPTVVLRSDGENITSAEVLHEHPGEPLAERIEPLAPAPAPA